MTITVVGLDGKTVVSEDGVVPSDAPAARVTSMEPRIQKNARPSLTLAPAPRCFAHQFVLDEKTRLAKCTKCDRAFDGFDALAYLAEHWPDFQGNREAIQRDLQSIEKKRDDVKKDVAKLTSTFRRRIRALTEASPHATRALELMMRLHRKTRRDSLYDADESALRELLRTVEAEAKIVPMVKPEKTPARKT